MLLLGHPGSFKSMHNLKYMSTQTAPLLNILRGRHGTTLVSNTLMSTSAHTQARDGTQVDGVGNWCVNHYTTDRLAWYLSVSELRLFIRVLLNLHMILNACVCWLRPCFTSLMEAGNGTQVVDIGRRLVTDGPFTIFRKEYHQMMQNKPLEKNQHI